MDSKSIFHNDIVEVGESGRQWFLPGHVSSIQAINIVTMYLYELGVLDDYDYNIKDWYGSCHVRGAWEPLDEDGDDMYFNFDGNEPWTVVTIASKD